MSAFHPKRKLSYLSKPGRQPARPPKVRDEGLTPLVRVRAKKLDNPAIIRQPDEY
jgi:hypothetical protein